MQSIEAPIMRQSLKMTGLYWLWITPMIMVIDRVSKMMAQSHLFPYEPQSVLPFFNLTLAFNKGAAFSFLNSQSGWQVWFFGLLALGVSTGLLLWMKNIKAKQRWLSIALALIVGGALGNLWDRVSYGHVIDFLDFHLATWHWPVFNIADSAICMGALMLLVEAVFKRD